MTGSLNRIDIRGKGYQALKDKWAEGPRAYLGLSSAGFPNCLQSLVPGAHQCLPNMTPAIEQHVNWIGECLEYMRQHKYQMIEATTAAEDLARASTKCCQRDVVECVRQLVCWRKRSR